MTAKILTAEETKELALVQAHVRANYDYPDFPDPVDVVRIRKCTSPNEWVAAEVGDWLIDDDAEGEVVRIIDGAAVSVWRSS